jgi:hypothetical protein
MYSIYDSHTVCYRGVMEYERLRAVLASIRSCYVKGLFGFFQKPRYLENSVCFRGVMEYERLLEAAGSFGLYQKLLCGILVFYTTFLCGINYYTQV